MTTARRLLVAGMTPALACLALAGAAASPSAAATTRSCSENDRFIQDVKTTNLSCKTGMAIVMQVVRSSSCFDADAKPRRCSVRVGANSYSCVPKKASGGTSIRCARKTRSVRFLSTATTG